MKRIIIRADGNARIGAGHLMRCLTVAEKIEKKKNVLFVCADEASAELAMEHGYSAFVLQTDYKDMIAELPLWERMAAQGIGGLGTGNVSILVDSYYVNNEYLQKLRNFGMVFLLDDMAEDVKAADVIINYNAFASEESYFLFEKEEYTKVYAGSKYIPVRADFVKCSYETKDKAVTALITTGGGDRDNIAGRILDAVYEQGMHYKVVTGRFNPHYEALCEYAQSHSGVEILHDVKDMAGLMRECDMAITAGGTTVYELCSMGVPFICFSYAENQEKLVSYIGEEEIALSAGKYHVDDEMCLRNMKAAFKRLKSNAELRRNCSSREKEVVDGLGAERIARLLEK